MNKVDGTEDKARKLQSLYVGSRCLLQNQSGNDPRWDRSEIIIEVLLHDQFMMRIDISQDDNVNH